MMCLGAVIEGLIDRVQFIHLPTGFERSRQMGDGRGSVSVTAGFLYVYGYLC